MTLLADRPARVAEHRPAKRGRMVMVVGVLGIYLFVAALTNPTAYLSTDTGGKAATVDAMVANGTWSPDLGYWAEDVDPDGSLYPMFRTDRIGDQWVNVTSLPMLHAVRPLYAIGGYRAALLVPMAGAIGAALLAVALAKRLGGDTHRVGWVVAVASPLAIYAVDLWEHTLGVAMTLAAVVLTIDVLQHRRAVPSAAGAGLLFGVAAAMRQEALVYGFASGLVMSLSLTRSVGLRRAVLPAFAMVGGLAAAVIAVAGHERLIYGTAVRAERSTATLGVGGQRLGERMTEAAVTGAGFFAGTDVAAVVFALLLAASLIWFAWSHQQAHDLRRPALVVGVLYGLLFVDLLLGGLRFVPGLLATAPAAAIGLVAGASTDRLRPVTMIAVGAMPLVWATQFLGGAGPQWGGRYLLTSAVLLLVVAVCGTHDDRRPLDALLAVGLVLSMISGVWLVERTRSVADTMDALAARPEPVTIFSDPFVPREGGPRVLDEQWLVAATADDRTEAIAVLRRLGVDQFVFVDLRQRDAADLFDGVSVIAVDELDLLGTTMTLTTMTSTTEDAGR